MNYGKTPWKLVFLLLATTTASYISRVNVSTAGPLLMQEFSLSQFQMGQVFSAFLLGYVLFQVPAGLLADRWGAKKLLTAAAWCWFALTILSVLLVPQGRVGGLIPGFFVFLILRFLLGISSSPTYPGAAKGVAQWVAPAFQARANGIVLASIGLGSALAPLIVSAIMVHRGWRPALLVSVVPALAVALLWSRTGNVPAHRPPISGDLKREDGSRDSRILASRSFILLTLSYTLQGYVGYIFVSWFYLYLVQERHFGLMSGAWMSSLPWVLTIFAVPLGGWLTDRLAEGGLGERWGRRIVPMVGLGLSGMLISLGAHTDQPVLAAIALAGATALVLSVEGPFWAMMMRVSGARSGRAGGIMNMGSNVGGFISPMLTPWIAARIGWENALHVAAVVAVAAALLWLGIGARGEASAPVGDPERPS
jgi:ACS family glucarate transporter-like MFS transporter